MAASCMSILKINANILEDKLVPVYGEQRVLS